tara:strand:+ start:1567 stop:1728 length:162 start_codon:yes stop_codon:yes gene_type:complete
MLEKLLTLCADDKFVAEMLLSTEMLEERTGSNPDTEQLKELLTNIQKLCQKIG